MGLRFRDLFGGVAQGIKFGADGLHRRQCGISVALVDNQLATYFGGAQAGIQALRAKLGISLALAINNGTDIVQQVRQMVFRPLAAPCGEVVLNRHAAFQLTPALAKGYAAPPEFPFRPPLATGPQFLHRTCHKDAAGTPFEGLGRVDKQRLERFRQFHPSVSRMPCNECTT